MANVTTRTDLLTAQDRGDVVYQAGRNQIAAFAREWKTGTTAGDLDQEWLDVRGAALFTVQVVPAGTLTATVQATIDGGKNWFSIKDEAAGASITAAGIYNFRGVYEYLRFKASAQSAAIVVSISFMAGA